MPRKKVTQKSVSQADVARLFADNLEIFSNRVLAELSEHQQDLGLSVDSLRKIQRSLSGIQTNVRETTMNQLIKLY